jgi:hypothetical protein
MEDTITKILYTILIGLIGYFTRDVYNYLKRKFIKSTKPKIVLEYNYRARSAHGTNPRLYKFLGTLLIQNIATQPVYSLQLIHTEDKIKNTILTENHLSPNEKKEISTEIEVPYGETGADYEGAKTALPDKFKMPEYKLYYKDENGHKYSQRAILK